ncbi:hypothetical protein ACJJTC_011357 [Scirpophaga incertulas]
MTNASFNKHLAGHSVERPRAVRLGRRERVGCSRSHCGRANYVGLHFLDRHLTLRGVRLREVWRSACPDVRRLRPVGAFPRVAQAIRECACGKWPSISGPPRPRIALFAYPLLGRRHPMPPKKRQPMPQDQQDVPARKPNRRRTAARRCHTIQPDSPTPLADTATSFADTADFETPANEKTKRSLPTSPSSSTSRPEPETRIPANKNKNESCLPTSEQPTPIPKITVELDTDKWMILNRHIRQKSGKEIPAAFVEDSNSDLYLEYYPRTVREYEIVWDQIIEDNCRTIGPPRWQPTTKPHNQPPKPTEPIEAISRRSPTPSRPNAPSRCYGRRWLSLKWATPRAVSPPQ